MAVTDQPVAQEEGTAGPPHVGAARRALLWGIVLSLLTPLLIIGAFQLGIWPLICVAFVPMLVAQHRVLPARWSGLGPAIGIGGMFGFHLSPGLVDGGLPVLAVVWPLLMAAVIAPLFWRSRRFHEATGYRWFLFSGPVAWVALDFLRSQGNAVLAATFGYPGYALWRHPALIQPVTVFGINGLELLLFLVNWALAGAVLAVIDQPSSERTGPRFGGRRASIGVGLAAVAVVAWVVGSVGLLAHPGPDVTVAAVQTGVDRDIERSPLRYERDIAQTRLAAAQGAQLIVWNEKGLAFDPRKEHTAELRQLAHDTGAYLAIGFGFKDSHGHRLNQVTVLRPDGRFLGPYGKNHPGTFAGDFSDTKGTYPVYETRLGRLATIICYDLDFTDTARRMARNGAQLVATPSADVPSIGKVHFTHLVFRAVEDRVAMVKADNEFDSVILDPYGRVLAKVDTSKGGRQATLVAAVPLGEGSSPWVSLGDWLGWVCVAGTAGLLVLGAVTRRRIRGERPSPV
jgi:apolipoprotein N-acyltransferase